MDNFTFQRLEDVCRRVSWFPGIVELNKLEDEIYATMCDHFADELHQVAKRIRSSNVVSLEPWRSR